MVDEASRPAIALLGPTASGKTDIAVKLVERFPFEIISVDASQVYRQMNIGTAKPNADILKRAPHHLIDCCDVTDSYSASQFSTDARRLMTEIYERNRIPLIVGGSMFYYQALVSGLDPMPSAEPKVRDRIQRLAEAVGWDKMHAKLARLDPVSAARIHPNDRQRIERALEINELTGHQVGAGSQSDASGGNSQFEFFEIAAVPSDRRLLHGRIEQRFRLMIEAGFETEVRNLILEFGDNGQGQHLRTVGYRQMVACLRDEIDFEQMIAQAVAATRQLAKRQLTWLRHWPGMVWCASDLTGFDDAVMKLVQSKLEKVPLREIKFANCYGA